MSVLHGILNAYSNISYVDTYNLIFLSLGTQSTISESLNILLLEIKEIYGQIKFKMFCSYIPFQKHLLCKKARDRQNVDFFFLSR